MVIGMRAAITAGEPAITIPKSGHTVDDRGRLGLDDRSTNAVVRCERNSRHNLGYDCEHASFVARLRARYAAIAPARARKKSLETGNTAESTLPHRNPPK